MEKLSVIICTYNPKQFVFQQCLDAISAAAVQQAPFEIIIVDNNSQPSLLEQEYISRFLKQQANARVVIAQKQGLTPARLKGIEEAKGDLLLYIDDDNIIREDFFLKGIDIADRNQHIGAWSGQVKLVFEKEPEAWTRRYWGMLVYREFNEDKWSNFPHFSETMPCGAGLFVRKKVADYYYALHRDGQRPVQLDRSGNSLLSAGDNDLAACACDIGLGVGLFSAIYLQHYIPASRVTKEYLLRLAEGITASSIVFKSFRGEMPAPLTVKNRLANMIRMMLQSSIDKQFYKAILRGERTGKAILDNGQ